MYNFMLIDYRPMVSAFLPCPKQHRVSLTKIVDKVKVRMRKMEVVKIKVTATLMLLRMIPDYNLEPGCTTNTDGLTPIEFFTMMVDNHMCDHIFAQTILYAEQYMATTTLHPHS